MNSFDERLSQGLRELAARAPQAAPPELGNALQQAFRRHHRRRRWSRRGTALAVCLLLCLAFLLVGKHEQPVPVAKPAPRENFPVRSPGTAKPGEKDQMVLAAPSPRRKNPRLAGGKRALSQGLDSGLANSFVALPSFDPSLPLDPSQMVRLVLPGSALRLVGYPVNEELAGRRVVTDVLLAPDGTPYALRLVSARSLHP
jgi:hypothetical protein